MLAAVAVLGIVWVATGHNRSGLTTLVIIGVLAVPTIAGRILRRRHSGG
jgi:glycine/D-amino acid oxidase-like deaminating enzyme